MSNIDCGACNDLREYAPDFVQNGVTNKICNSLANDTGLNPNLTTLHTDCEDLKDVNDCLVGRMDGEIEAYEVCDWKKYMHKFIPNLYETIKAGICSICGLWKNIHKHECEIEYLYSGATFRFNEETSGDAYAVAGKGVSFLNIDATATSANLYLVYIAGGLMLGGGSYLFYNTDFTDAAPCGNFDLETTYSISSARKGNTAWLQTGLPLTGGELICEFRIKKSAFPQINRFFRGFGQEADGGVYQVNLLVFTAGMYAYGQHGRCNSVTGEGLSGGDAGHMVPDGWIYLQLRMMNIWSFDATPEGSQSSPCYHFGVRMNRDKIDC